MLIATRLSYAHPITSENLIESADIAVVAGETVALVGPNQRASIARALGCRADVLLLYEPTNNLDIEAMEALESTLRAFEGVVLFAAHDKRFVENIATEVIEFSYLATFFLTLTWSFSILTLSIRLPSVSVMVNLYPSPSTDSPAFG